MLTVHAIKKQSCFYIYIYLQWALHCANYALSNLWCEKPGLVELLLTSIRLQIGQLPLFMARTHPRTNSPHRCITHTCMKHIHTQTGLPGHVFCASLQHRWLNSGCLPTLWAPPSLFLYIPLSPLPPPPLKAELHPPQPPHPQYPLSSPSPLPNSFHTMPDTRLFGLPPRASAKWPDRFGSIHHCNHVV